jgi:hypothetical protein
MKFKSQNSKVKKCRSDKPQINLNAKFAKETQRRAKKKSQNHKISYIIYHKSYIPLFHQRRYFRPILLGNTHDAEHFSIEGCGIGIDNN